MAHLSMLKKYCGRLRHSGWTMMSLSAGITFTGISTQFCLVNSFMRTCNVTSASSCNMSSTSYPAVGLAFFQMSGVPELARSITPFMQRHPTSAVKRRSLNRLARFFRDCARQLFEGLFLRCRRAGHGIAWSGQRCPDVAAYAGGIGDE